MGLRWLAELKTGKGYTFADFKKELKDNEMAVIFAMGAYTGIYAICMWIGYKGWAPEIKYPFWRLVILEGVLKPSPMFIIIAPLSLSLFTISVSKLRNFLSKKSGTQVVDNAESVKPDEPGDEKKEEHGHRKPTRRKSHG